ncbi:hypothetical protein CNR22_17090 [Sphingobacteriaceae bacterium]|nr:hypothetical protein CNR22_17090 [Sphingobacteriaceae bacterium]
MKQNLTLCLLLLSLIGFSQAPELINYQGIARDASGAAIAGNVDLKFDLHQGGATSPTVFTEAQTVNTTSLGLFSTQIGKTSNLGAIDWQSGSLFLEVSLRLSGGTYTSLGTQQLVSVPFSMLAKSVPASYTNNVLTIGSNAFTLSPSTGAVYTASTGIAITSGSILTNTAPDVPVTFTSTSTNIAVNGTYPNFSLSYTAPANASTSLTLNGADNNSLSAGSNTVVLNTYTAGAGLTISGGPNYTISSSVANPTITGVGAAVVTPTTGTNFVVSVANPTLSSSGNSVTLTQGTLVTTATIAATPATSLSAGTNVNIAGTNPYTIAATPTLNLLTANTLSISGGNSITIAPTVSVSGNGSLSVGPLTNSVNIAPNLLGTGAVSVSGTFPNYTIFATPAGSVTVISTTVTGTNLANVTSTATNLYNVDVQPPTFTPAGPVSISGTYPNYTINSSAGVTYTNGTGISITSGSIITNTSPNITPTIVITSTAAAGSSVTSSGSSFSINVPPAIISSSGNTITVTHGTTITTATISAGPTTSLVPAGVVSMTATGTNSFIVGVPGPTLTSNGNTLTITQGTAVTSATVAGSPTTSLVPAGVVSMTATGTNSFIVGVPGPTLTSNGNTLTITQGTAVSTATVPASITYTNGTGISITSGSVITNANPDQVVTLANGANISVSGTYPAFTIASPSPTFTPNGPVTITGTYPSMTVNSTAAPVYTNGAGISVTGSVITNTSPNQTVSVASGANINVSGTYPAYTISSPTPTFTPSGPVTITGTYPNMTINSTAAVTYTNGTGISITSGSIITNTNPDQVVTVASGSNINVSGTYPGYTISSPTPTFTPNGPVTITGTYPSMTVNSTAAPSASFTQGGIVNISTITANSYSISVLPATIAVTFSAAANPAVTTTGNSFNINIPPAVAPNITVSSSLAAAGISTTSANNFNINVPSPNIVVSQTAGAVGISTTSANNYNINIPLANGAWGLLGNATTTAGTNFIGTTDARDLQFKTNNTLAMVINTLGSVGIGTTSPASKFHVSNGAASGATGYFEINNASGSGDALIALSSSGINNTYALRAINTNTTTLTSYGAMIEGGTILRPKNVASAFILKAQTNGGSDLFTIRNDGAVTMSTSATGNDLTIFNSGTNAGIQLKNSSSASFGFIIGQNTIATNVLSYENTPMYFGNNGSNKMVLSAAGNLGIGSGAFAPTATLEVAGTVKIADGTQGANKVLTSDASGNATWQNTGVPAGAIMAYGGTVIPTGWTLCDGTTLSRTTYSVLFAAIGTAWGVGNGTTTFNVPDMRGMFLRGVDGAASNDPDASSRTATNSGNAGNNVGSKQADEFESHTHSISNVGSTTLAGLGLTNLLSPSGTSNTNASGGSTETRPKNVYVYYMIKH